MVWRSGSFIRVVFSEWNRQEKRMLNYINRLQIFLIVVFIHIHKDSIDYKLFQRFTLTTERWITNEIKVFYVLKRGTLMYQMNS